MPVFIFFIENFHGSDHVLIFPLPNTPKYISQQDECWAFIWTNLNIDTILLSE